MHGVPLNAGKWVSRVQGPGIFYRSHTTGQRYRSLFLGLFIYLQRGDLYFDLWNVTCKIQVFGYAC